MRCNAHVAPDSCTRSLRQLLGSVDIETGGEETKVRLWWHEHWQTRYSSKEAEEEVTMPTQTPRVQQVRAKIASSPHHLRQPRSGPPQNRFFPRKEVAMQLGSAHVRYNAFLRRSRFPRH